MLHPDHTTARLRAVFAAAAVALLAVTVWMLLSDSRREWKKCRPRGDRRIEQIWLPELTIDYHFCHVGRTDRCVTCHQNIATVLSDAIWLRRPFSHPRLDLFVGENSPHPMSRFGCTICHDGQGTATEFRFASHMPDDMGQRRAWREQHDWYPSGDWDHPMMPRRFFESRCLQCHVDVVDLEPSRRFPDPPAPKLVAGYHLVRQLGCFGCHEIKGISTAGERVGPDLRLEPPQSTGTMRKVGPSLREVGSRLERPFLTSWIAEPARFRPDSRMPRLFGQEEHLDEASKAKARRLEAVEIDALAQWLRDVSGPVEVLAAPAGVSEPASVERGRRLLLTQGCLACHKHDDYPEATGTQGPNLSRLGAKYTSAASAAWLADWLRDPARHSPRTLMPNPLLEPIAVADAPGKSGAAKMTDPVADLVAYLLAAKGHTLDASPPPPDADLDELVLAHLAVRYTRDEAKRIVDHGLWPQQLAAATDDQCELIAPISRRKKLHYVARRTIAKRGCFGCHDIPGFEQAQPIGPVLSDWGRKDPSLLAFGRIAQLLEADGTIERAKTDRDVGYYLDALRARRREGFLWQKLRAPRSFDYRLADRRGFNEWLKMGRFTLDPAQREAIATFVLGLVGRTPEAKYVYHPGAAARAVVEGRKMLDRYACAECHVMEMARWRFEYRPGQFDATPPDATADATERVPPVGARGLARAEVIGQPRLADDGRPAVFEGDEEDAAGEPLPMRAFTLWEPAAIDGRLWPVGGPDVLLYDRQIIRQYSSWGGAAIGLLYPAALAGAKAAGASVVGPEAWGHLPPPLVGEGAKVRADWLAEYLLNPQPIRPAAMMKMPRYTFSDDEVDQMVDFFAAHASVSRITGIRGATGILPVPLSRLDQAMHLLTDRKTFCAKCHVIGDYRPAGVTATVGPDLAVAGRRLRPEYIRRWLAQPQGTLPYTPMPVNFPPAGEPLGQDLLPGDSRQQIDAMVELLERYDEYLRAKTPVREMVK